jgi:hypothetical protein
MTKAWGPLGWATLHSVAALYPDEPSELEKTLITKWMDSFRNCIVCTVCKDHFTALLRDYNSLYPNWNASRKDFSLFVLRAHNTVNVRQLGRKSLSMDEVFPKLKQYVSPEQAAAKRKSYVVYIRADWGKSLNFDGFTAAKYIKELILIETEYWSNRPSFTWDEIRKLVEGESIEAIAGSKPAQRSIFNAVQGSKPPQRSVFNTIRAPTTRQPVATAAIQAPINGKPRFSFLSR